MNKQQIVSFLILLIFTAGAAYFVMGAADYKPFLERLTENQKEDITKNGDNIEIQETTDTYSITALYPSSAPIEVQEYIENLINEFKNYESVSESSLYDLNVTVDQIQSREYQSYVITHSEYTGGANTNTFVKTFVYDNTELVSFNGLFSNTEISELIVDDLNEQFGEDNWFRSALDEEEVFDNFSFEEDQVVITFSQYQIAPGSLGIVNVRVPISEIVEKEEVGVVDFFSCVDVTGEVLESYPRQCIFEGTTFVEEIQDIKPLPITEKLCVVAGCSAQLCISKDELEAGGGISTCEFREEYACYRTTECEIQLDGACGWTQTEELQKCIADVSLYTYE